MPRGCQIYRHVSLTVQLSVYLSAEFDSMASIQAKRKGFHLLQDDVGNFERISLAALY